MSDDEVIYHSGVPCPITWDHCVWKSGFHGRGYVVIYQQGRIHLWDHSQGEEFIFKLIFPLQKLATLLLKVLTLFSPPAMFLSSIWDLIMKLFSDILQEPLSLLQFCYPDFRLRCISLLYCTHTCYICM